MQELIRLLPDILRATDNAQEVLEAAALAAWRRVAGEGLREHAVPFRLCEKTLIVAVPDATWQRQMEDISRKLLFRLNALLGQAAVTYIEFRIDPETIGAVRSKTEHEQAARQEQERRALECAASLQEAAANIKNVKLRRQFLLAAGSCIERRSKGV
jgi:hypothetical protein